MNQSDGDKGAGTDRAPGARVLTPAAQRALDEAEARRRAAKADAPVEKEINGRGGAEPVRFGDWEVKGIATDF